MPQHNERIRIIISNIRANTNQVVAVLASEIRTALVKANPVDTGWARANWIPSIGRPFRGNNRQLSQEARRSRASGAEAQGDAATNQISSRYDTSQGSVYISNNVPYITPLNERGSSRSGGVSGVGAGPLWIQSTINATVARVRSRLTRS